MTRFRFESLNLPKQIRELNYDLRQTQSKLEQLEAKFMFSQLDLRCRDLGLEIVKKDGDGGSYREEYQIVRDGEVVRKFRWFSLNNQETFKELNEFLNGLSLCQ